MKIITGGTSYPEQRNVITSSFHRYEDHRFRNVWTWINLIRRRLLRKNKLFLFHPLPLVSEQDAGIAHLFNEVSTGRGNWVSTFETELPRVLPVKGLGKFQNPELARELDFIRSPQCRGIIAISEATRTLQLRLLEHFPAQRDAIVPKLHVLHPPQPLLHERRAPSQDRPLTFTFVGREFFRKGGAEIILAFSKLLSDGAIAPNQICVNLVGDVSLTHNVAHGAFQDSEKFHEKIINTLNTTPVFRHFSSLPNDDILSLIGASDVGLLPTWQDTYGFSVLEMQACACPVISTNVRALPEINPDGAGWLIKCPLNDALEIAVQSENQKAEIREMIVAQLKTLILHIFHSRQVVARKSEGSVARIRQEHDPEIFQQRLNAIYAGGPQM